MTPLSREQWTAIAALFQHERNAAMSYMDAAGMRSVTHIDLLENHIYNLVEAETTGAKEVGGLTEAHHALLDDMDMLAIELNRSVGMQSEAARLREMVNRTEAAFAKR